MGRVVKGVACEGDSIGRAAAGQSRVGYIRVWQRGGRQDAGKRRGKAGITGHEGSKVGIHRALEEAAAATPCGGGCTRRVRGAGNMPPKRDKKPDAAIPCGGGCKRRAIGAGTVPPATVGSALRGTGPLGPKCESHSLGIGTNSREGSRQRPQRTGRRNKEGSFHLQYMDTGVGGAALKRQLVALPFGARSPGITPRGKAEAGGPRR